MPMPKSMSASLNFCVSNFNPFENYLRCGVNISLMLAGLAALSHQGK
jgi:hypothetical protein